MFRDLAQAWTLEEDRWVESVEVLPGDRSVVHHVIIYVLKPGQTSPDSWLGAWAAGMEPMTFPEGTGRLIRAGSTIIADMHYHPGDEAATDQTRIGLYFHDAEPEKELVNLWVQNAGFKIPAGAPNHEVRSAYTFLQDSVIHGFLPHMHYRGKDFSYALRYPDGREETVLKVSGYDFNWQTLYELEDPIEVPKGTKVLCVAHYDNSEANLANPDPTRDVTFGNESFDEMMIGFVDYTVKDGLRPLSAEERLTNIMRELLAEHPGEVFDVMLEADGTLATGLYFPKEGNATWYIPVNGELWESNLTGLKRDDEGTYTAKLVTPFGTFDVTGTGGPEAGTVEGVVDMGAQGTMTYEGKLAGSV